MQSKYRPRSLLIGIPTRRVGRVAVILKRVEFKLLELVMQSIHPLIAEYLREYM